MWLAYAFLSAAMLGCYDVFKKHALRGNSVLPVLFLNTLFCSLIFLLPLLLSLANILPSDHLLYVSFPSWSSQKYILLKSCIVLSSWVLGYYGMKHLPLTIVGPINATRPVMVLLGALVVFGERLNAYQWTGVALSLLSFFLLSRTSKKEGIDFKHNRWIYCIVGAAVLGALSGLYDKYLMAPAEFGGVALNRMEVQCYYNFYQCAMMGAICLYSHTKKGLLPLRQQSVQTDILPPASGNVFRFVWTIPFISLFLSFADFVYFYSLSLEGAMVSIVSMVRRSSVIVSFLIAACAFREKNLSGKAIDLLLVLLGMFFLWLGSK